MGFATETSLAYIAHLVKTGALVYERERLFIVEPFKLGGGVASRLVLDGCDLLAPVFGLASITPTGFLSDEEHVVGWADVCLVLADGDAETGTGSTVMRALPRATVVTTEYQRDSSSKRPRSSVASAARAPTRGSPSGCQPEYSPRKATVGA